MAGLVLAAWLAAAGASSGGVAPLPLPPGHLAIALKVAGQGLPGCRAYHPDGSEGPCLPRFTLKPGRSINGWSLNGHITLTQGATQRLNPDEFALLAGHEIAHWYLGHRGSSLEAELAADRLGAELACAAGYDVARGAGLFRWLRGSRVHAARLCRTTDAMDTDCSSNGHHPTLKSAPG